MWTVLIAFLVAGTLGSLTDWLFMGVLFHAAYNRYPEVWWPRGGNNSVAIIWASALGYLMTAGVFGLCMVAHAHSILQGLVVAVLAWIAGPLVPIVVNGFFIKLDPRITFAHSIGYLARLALAGIAAGAVLR
jgi:hypothetical protein